MTMKSHVSWVYAPNGYRNNSKLRLDYALFESASAAKQHTDRLEEQYKFDVEDGPDPGERTHYFGTIDEFESWVLDAEIEGKIGRSAADDALEFIGRLECEIPDDKWRDLDSVLRGTGQSPQAEANKTGLVIIHDRDSAEAGGQAFVGVSATRSEAIRAYRTQAGTRVTVYEPSHGRQNAQ